MSILAGLDPLALIRDQIPQPKPYEFLAAAEEVYLQASGWVEIPEHGWSKPSIKRHALTRRHAVNVQVGLDTSVLHVALLLDSPGDEG